MQLKQEIIKNNEFCASPERLLHHNKKQQKSLKENVSPQSEKKSNIDYKIIYA